MQKIEYPQLSGVSVNDAVEAYLKNLGRGDDERVPTYLPYIDERIYVADERTV
jgi:hypothetical protein